jgi:hypothetical protein
MTSVLATGAHNLLEQGPSGSMTTMDNRVGEGQGGVAATYCIDYVVVYITRVNRNEDVTVGLYLHVQQVPRAYLPPTWTEPTYSQHSPSGQVWSIDNSQLVLESLKGHTL